MVFCNYVGWSKLVFINTILCKPTLNNDHMNMNMLCTLFPAMKGEGFSSIEYYLLAKIVYILMRLGALLIL